MIELVDRFLDHATTATRDVWLDAIPLDVLDLWAMRGDFERTYAVLDLGTRRGEQLAWYAALDRDPARASRAALRALDAAGSLPMQVLGTVPYTDDAVVRAALALVRRKERFSDEGRLWPRVLQPANYGVLELDQLESHPTLLAVAAKRLGGDAGEPFLARALDRIGDSEDTIRYIAARPWAACLLATRALGAWHAIPVDHRIHAARIAAFDGQLALVEDWIREADSDHAKAALRASAAIAGPPPVAWHESLKARVASAQLEYEEGLLYENEFGTLELAALACDGDSALAGRIAAILVAAHAAAQNYGAALVAPREARVSSEVTRSNTLNNVDELIRGATLPIRVMRALSKLGRRGDLELVREAVDRIEAALGPIGDIQFGRELLAYYPGRSREALARLEFATPGTSAPVIAALARDGHLADAHAFAARALADTDGWYRDDLQMIAPVVLADSAARDRLTAVLQPLLATLPGHSLDAAREWLAVPIVRHAEPSTASARSPEIEASLIDRDDDATALVYADFLQSHGDPRGELAMLQANGRLVEARILLERHAGHFFGPLAEFTRSHVLDGQPFEWRHGFIRTARFGFDDSLGDTADSLARAMTALLVHPSGALLRELEIAVNIVDGACDLAPASEAIVAHGAPALRRLRLGWLSHAGPRSPANAPSYEISWVRFGDLRELWSRVPRLASLTLQGSLESPILEGIQLPAATELAIITGGMCAENTRAIAAADWPNLETLELWFGSPDYGFTGSVDDVLPLLAGKATPKLRTLRLVNATFTDELVEPLARSPLLPQLREVSLALGMLSDDGAARLAHHAARFAHLERLDLEHSCMTRAGIDLVENVTAEVLVAANKDIDDHFVSVGE